MLLLLYRSLRGFLPNDSMNLEQAIFTPWEPFASAHSHVWVGWNLALKFLQLWTAYSALAACRVVLYGKSRGCHAAVLNIGRRVVMSCVERKGNSHALLSQHLAAQAASSQHCRPLNAGMYCRVLLTLLRQAVCNVDSPPQGE